MNLCGGNIPPNAVYPRDGHGGNSIRHRAEMRKIAEEAINDLVPHIAEKYFTEAAEKIIGAIQYDIETIVSVAVDSGEEIFNSKKCKQVISDRIVKEIKASLSNITIKI